MSEHLDNYFNNKFNNYIIHELTIKDPDEQGDQEFHGIFGEVEEEVLPTEPSLVKTTLSRNIFPDFKDPSNTPDNIEYTQNPNTKFTSTANPPPPIQEDSSSVSSTESSKSSLHSSIAPELQKSYNKGGYKSNMQNVFLRSRMKPSFEHQSAKQTYNSNSNSEHGYKKAAQQRRTRRTTRKKRPVPIHRDS